MIKKVTSQQELDDAVAAGHQVVVHEGEYEVAGSATVRAYGSATVWAYGSATVRAGDLVAVRRASEHASISGGVVIEVLDLADPLTWARFHGLDVDEAAGTVVVFKAVESDWRGGQKRDDITYRPGDTPEALDWREDGECGHGLHFVPVPWRGDAYLSAPAAHYVACTVPLADTIVIDGDKVKSRRVLSIVECDQDGEVVQ